jgi:aurora kinase, other
LNRLIQEIKIQSSLSHPNILNLYGYTADAEKVYLLLEPCLGSNAYKRLNKKPMPEKEVKKHIKEICSAVEYLHKRDIIHRDIKAENILFHENTAKLCDFGWAVYAPMLRNTQCGTPLYTPPEIVKNEYYDSKVDLWCVGVLTYEMLYGTSPFEIRSIWDLAKIVEEKVFFSKEINISESAQEFVDKCLSKTPSNRLNIRQAL